VVCVHQLPSGRTHREPTLRELRQRNVPVNRDAGVEASNGRLGRIRIGDGEAGDELCLKQGDMAGTCGYCGSLELMGPSAPSL